jgi:hypothetical protein
MTSQQSSVALDVAHSRVARRSPGTRAFATLRRTARVKLARAIGALFEHCTGACCEQPIPQSNGARDVGQLADDKCARHYGQVSLTIIDRPR